MKVDISNLKNINDFGSIDPKELSSMLASYGIVTLLISILIIVELWIIFKKCGKKGYLSIIPFANLWTLFTIVDLPGWLSLIPVANLVGLIVAYFKLPVKFGKSAAYGLGILFFPFIFLGLLAFSKEKEAKEEIPPMINENETNSINELPIEQPKVEEISVNNQNELVADSLTIIEQPITNEVNDQIEPDTLNEMEATIQITTPEQVAEEQINEVTKDSEIPSAFEMQPPVLDNQVVNDAFANETLDNMPQTNNDVVIETPNINIDSPLNTNEDVPNIFDIPSNQASVPNNDKPLTEEELEATFELPKMANEIINSDIKETKTCPNCGHINEYPNKNCSLCGTPLE